MLTFDAAQHVYRWDGVVVPHVTGIIAHLTDYDRIPADVLERARQEGIAIHKMVELDCAKDLNVEALPDWMKPRYAAWCRFLEETGFDVWSSERRVYHQRLGYAGTLDLSGQFRKLRTSKKPAIVDVKRSFYAGDAIGLQTVAYLDASNSEKGAERLYERYALRLDANGSYRLQPYTDRQDSTAFLACLQQLRWKDKHGTR